MFWHQPRDRRDRSSVALLSELESLSAMSLKKHILSVLYAPEIRRGR